jgi:hypothetical protein
MEVFIMPKNETEKQVQAGEPIDTTAIDTQGEQATETEPKKEGLVAKAKKKASGLMNKQISFTPKDVLLGIGKGVLAIGAVTGAFALGKKIQQANDNAMFETDFVGEEPVEALPDNVVEEVYEEPVEEFTTEEYVEE